MRVLIISNLYPREDQPTGGIFIIKRVEHFKSFGINYKAFCTAYYDSFSVKVFKKMLKKKIREHSDNSILTVNNIEFVPIWHKVPLLERISFKYFPHIEKKIIESTADKMAQEIIKKIDKKFDIIHAHGMFWIPAGLIALHLFQTLKIPYIVTLHGSDVNILMKRRIDVYISTLEKSKKTIFVSNALLERAKSYGYSGKNSIVIPNGYDPEIFYPMDKTEVRKKLGIYRENTYYVGFVGNLIPVKRADKLGEIFGYVAKVLPNTKFIVVGDGYLKKKIEKETKDLDIIFTGRLPQKEVALWMNAMDVMVLPSRNEGWPCVLLEAQACGTCVIGSSNGGIPEAIGFKEHIVEEGENFEKRFAEKVLEVLQNGYNVKAIMQRIDNFKWSELVKKEIMVYKEVLLL